MWQFFTHNSSCLLGYSDTKRQGKNEGKDTFCFGNVGYVLHISSVEYIFFLLYCQIRHLYFEKMSFQETKNEPRQDWQQTSTGVGHHHRPGYYFPNSDFKVFTPSNIMLFGIIVNCNNTADGGMRMIERRYSYYVLRCDHFELSQ